MLWLRIAADVLARVERAEESLGADWETRFADSLERVDEEARLEIVRRLSGSSRALMQLADAFLQRTDTAALWAIEHAPGLPDQIRYRALTSPILSPALARRADLSPSMTDEIIEECALATLIELGANQRLRLTRLQIAKLIERAAAVVRLSGDDRLARAVLQRAPLTVDFAPLFLEASSAQRAQILFAAERAGLAAIRAPALAPLSEERIIALERHALERQEPLFVEALASALNCDRLWAQGIVQDAFGEPLAVTLAALGAPNDVCVRILTARDMAEGPDYPRLSALARLQGAMSPAAAWVIVKAMLGEAASHADVSTSLSHRAAPVTPSRGAEIARAYRRERRERERRSGETG